MEVFNITKNGPAELLESSIKNKGDPSLEESSTELGGQLNPLNKIKKKKRNPQTQT